MGHVAHPTNGGYSMPFILGFVYYFTLIAIVNVVSVFIY